MDKNNAMSVLQYNVLNGCQGDPDRLTRLGAWLKQQAYDVVGLNAARARIVHNEQVWVDSFDANNRDLKVVHCSNRFCVPFFRRR